MNNDKQSTISKKLSWTLLASAIAAAPLQAAELEEVVVTAQKRAQGANDVGITVNAFTGDQIAEMGVATAEDIAVLTPGLTVNETAATGVPSYTIRGVGFQDYTTSSSSTVGLYFDEVAMPYTVMSRGAIFDVERVEVLKGPQGDLYGRNTTAGQINFVSNKPTEEFEAGVKATVANFGVLDFEGFVSGGLSDAVRGRLAIKSTRSSEGWQESLTRDDELGEKDVLAVKSLFDIDISEDVSLLLKFHYVDDQSDNKAQTAFNGLDAGLPRVANAYNGLDQYTLDDENGGGARVLTLTSEPPWHSINDNQAADWTNTYASAITGKTWNIRPQRDNQLAGLSAKLEWDLGDITLTSITAYDEFEREEANDWDGSAFNDSSNINTTDLEVFSQEIRLSGETDNLLWIAGVYYSEDEMDEYYHYFMSDSRFGNGGVTFNVIPFAFNPILELDTRYQQETESLGLFGHVEWSFADDWRLTVGARYTDEERTWTGCTYSAEDGTLASFWNNIVIGGLFGAPGASSIATTGCATIDDDPASPGFILSQLAQWGAGDIANVNAAFQPYSNTIDDENLMWKLGLDYQLTEDVLLYGTYSVGFKSGGFNGANSNTTTQLKPIKEEQLEAFEFGFKATLLDNSMQLNGAAFFYDYQDKQEQALAVAVVGNISGLTNVPESEITGAELDMQWLPADNWKVNLGIAWLDTEITRWDAVSDDSTWAPDGSGVVTFDASGLELAQSPELSYNALVEYSWAVSDGVSMKVAVDYVFQDDTSGGAQESDATEDYGLTNARIGIESDEGTWSLLFWGRNITDEYYYPAAYVGGNGPYVRSLGMPRTYGLTLSYNL